MKAYVSIRDHAVFAPSHRSSQYVVQSVELLWLIKPTYDQRLSPPLIRSSTFHFSFPWDDVSHSPSFSFHFPYCSQTSRTAVYTNSLLATLNARKMIRDAAEGINTTTGDNISLPCKGRASSSKVCFKLSSAVSSLMLLLGSIPAIEEPQHQYFHSSRHHAGVPLWPRARCRPRYTPVRLQTWWGGDRGRSVGGQFVEWSMFVLIHPRMLKMYLLYRTLSRTFPAGSNARLSKFKVLCRHKNLHTDWVASSSHSLSLFWYMLAWYTIVLPLGFSPSCWSTTSNFHFFLLYFLFLLRWLSWCNSQHWINILLYPVVHRDTKEFFSHAFENQLYLNVEPRWTMKSVPE